MLSTLLKLSSEVKVVDISGKTAGVYVCQFPNLPLLCAPERPGSLLVFLSSLSVFLLVSAGAQLLEQTARLQNLSDALDKLKVTTSESYLFSSPCQ